jgi:hypothetical protein
MKGLISLITAICLTGAVWGTPEARINHTERNAPVTGTDDRPGLGHTAALDETFLNDLHIGALWFPSISSKGYIGYYDISGFYPGGGDQSAVW